MLYYCCFGPFRSPILFFPFKLLWVSFLALCFQRVSRWWQFLLLGRDLSSYLKIFAIDSTIWPEYYCLCPCTSCNSIPTLIYVCAFAHFLSSSARTSIDIQILLNPYRSCHDKRDFSCQCCYWNPLCKKETLCPEEAAENCYSHSF